RAGGTGSAISFVTADAAAHFRLVEKRHGLSLPRERLRGFEPTDVAAPVRDPHGGVKGKRKSKKDKAREAAGRAANPVEEKTAEASGMETAKETTELFPWRPRVPRAGRGI
ncbi:MAG TPA: hypothetical protein VEA63_06785, partial [Opitutus sp.]|nr:hypothetical protein [Opitutus sp.]